MGESLMGSCLIHTWLQPGGYSARLTGNRLNGLPIYAHPETPGWSQVWMRGCLTSNWTRTSACRRLLS